MDSLFRTHRNDDAVYTQKKARGNGFTRFLISLLVTAVFAAVWFYLTLPALNIHTGELYWFVFWLCIVFSACMILLRGFRGSAKDYVGYTRKKLVIPFYLLLAVLAVVIVGWISGWVMLRPNAYAALLETDTHDFAEDVAEISFDQIPMLDEVSAGALANRKLGELSDLVSQFEVNDESCQINYQGAPTRVTYLNYGDLFKWWNNRKDGIPAYLSIDMVTQEVTVNRLSEGMRYSPSEYFFRNIDRYLRFRYPTALFIDTNFEVDEEGTPYWVASVGEKTIGLFGGMDLAGAVLVNAVTGECTYYDVADVPTWVDRVYTAGLLIQQYDYYGQYHNGFWNSLFGQRDCTVTTDGYNYIAMNDDVWMYTGVTSLGGDESNVGFLLVNQRTKEAHYYPVAGAEEYSAMSSAEGAVQQYAYSATFPLLLNISGQPTYFMALKDSSQLVKMYALVNVQQYQIVATGYSVEEALENYGKQMIERNVLDNVSWTMRQATEEQPQVTGRIEEIRSAVMDGNTWYFFRIEDVYYKLSAAEFPMAVILNEGDRVTLEYAESDDAIREASSLTVE